MAELEKLELKISAALKEFVNSTKPSSKVVVDISPVLDATSELPLTNLEYWERFIRDEYDNALASGYSNRWRFWQSNTPRITLLDLCSWDGYRREKALKTISEKVPNKLFLALVLRRLNDWVPQVRQAAQDALAKVLANTEPSYVADVICFTFSHWSSWQRIDNSNRKTLLDTLANKEIARHVKLKLINSAAGPLASIFSEVGRTDALDDSLEEIATSAIQPSLRARAYRCLLENKVSWFEGREWEWTDRRYNEGRMKPIIAERTLSHGAPLLPTLLTASNDRSSFVRRVAAEILIKELDNLGSDSSVLANKFAIDRVAAVAERGKFALKKLAGDTLF
ncbi:hypothetical protein F0267_11585 [Vibrio coralliilyticus]|uniref:HEAT repeat domain-containing protein n=1 Tax=Vibrio coralliilyticus TaxID=190893 RepID=A0AAN0SH68_9VIBR|nr:hypothetical protein [Vibrio coralliilyticus]AIW20923.1 hypothetical protein IX92_17935 [Vibrio coralliilyticus]NOH38878.1 hypothetical protein [Vibrio coralliilyticus]